jgi:hypothetical protein
MRSAYSAGRYKAMLEASDTHPFWEYRHVTMINYREEHKSWNGRLLRADDPFWFYAYPPSKFGCNCRVIARSARYAEGKEVLSSEGYQTQYTEKIGLIALRVLMYMAHVSALIFQLRTVAQSASVLLLGSITPLQQAMPLIKSLQIGQESTWEIRKD